MNVSSTRRDFLSASVASAASLAVSSAVRGEAIRPPAPLGKAELTDLAKGAGSGTTLGVLGPNGAGKTALLKSMLGLLPLLGGRLVFPTGRPPRVGSRHRRRLPRSRRRRSAAS